MRCRCEIGRASWSSDVCSSDLSRNLLPALPCGGRIKETTVATGMEIGAALHAGFIERRRVESHALLTAAVALEHFRTETAGGATSWRAFDALPLRLGTRSLRARIAATRTVRTVPASVLISLMFVFAIAHIHLTKTRGRAPRGPDRCR